MPAVGPGAAGCEQMLKRELAALGLELHAASSSGVPFCATQTRGDLHRQALPSSSQSPAPIGPDEIWKYEAAEAQEEDTIQSVDTQAGWQQWWREQVAT